MFRKFTVRLFTIIFLPLIACQLPGGQVTQPAADVTLIPTAPSTLEPTPTRVEGTSLVFETIELREPVKPDYWQDKNPGLLIIASPEDIAKASQYITDEAITTLSQMDFSQSFGLIAFQGWRPTAHYEFEIQMITRSNDQISIFANPSRASGSEVVSSKYHLVKIHKEGNWAQTFMFHLYIDDKETTAIPVSAYIP